MSVAFKEEQRFTQWWLWLILLPIAALPIWGIIQQIFLGEPFGDKPMSNWGLWLFALAAWGLVYFFWAITLKTVIDSMGIRLNFSFLARRDTSWQEVKSLEIVIYGFVGYGIRFGSKHGIVYNVKGNKGLAVELHSGRKFLIGTQREDELESFLNSVQPDKLKEHE